MSVGTEEDADIRGGDSGCCGASQAEGEGSRTLIAEDGFVAGALQKEEMGAAEAEGVNPWLDFGLEVGTRTLLDAVHGRVMLEVIAG